jgi:hypothetical protein
MVHSPMSPQPFEQNHQFSSQALAPSPTKQIPCALPKLEYLQLIDSKPLAHSSKKHGGIPLFFPFRNSYLSNIRKIVAKFSELPKSSRNNVECGASAPPLTNDTSPPNSQLAQIPTIARSVSHSSPIHPHFTPHSQLRAILSPRPRFHLDIPKSSANIPMLSV